MRWAKKLDTEKLKTTTDHVKKTLRLGGGGRVRGSNEGTWRRSAPEGRPYGGYFWAAFQSSIPPHPRNGPGVDRMFRLAGLGAGQQGGLDVPIGVPKCALNVLHAPLGGWLVGEGGGANKTATVGEFAIKPLTPPPPDLATIYLQYNGRRGGGWTEAGMETIFRTNKRPAELLVLAAEEAWRTGVS